MASGTKTCRVCGKEYACCGGTRPNVDGVFRYRDVACSPECGAIYLANINKSRGIEGKVEVVNDEVVVREKQKEPEIKAPAKKNKKSFVEMPIIEIEQFEEE